MWYIVYIVFDLQFLLLLVSLVFYPYYYHYYPYYYHYNFYYYYPTTSIKPLNTQSSTSTYFSSSMS